MRCRALRCWSAGLLCAAICQGGCVEATVQTAPDGFGKLTGSITNRSGNGVAGAKVIATNTDTGVYRSGVSDVNGSYSLDWLQSGNYTLEVVGDGYQRVLKEDLKVVQDEATQAGVTLTPASDVSPLLDAPLYLDIR